jgi:hypothetical protein
MMIKFENKDTSSQFLNKKYGVRIETNWERWCEVTARDGCCITELD